MTKLWMVLGAAMVASLAAMACGGGSKESTGANTPGAKESAAATATPTAQEDAVLICNALADYVQKRATAITVTGEVQASRKYLTAVTDADVANLETLYKAANAAPIPQPQASSGADLAKVPPLVKQLKASDERTVEALKARDADAFNKEVDVAGAVRGDLQVLIRQFCLQ